MIECQESGGFFEGEAKWNLATEGVEIRGTYSVRDWKKNQPSPQIPIEGRDDLAVICSLGSFFGYEEDWGPAGKDYSAVFGCLSVRLIDAVSGKPVPSILVLLEGNPKHYFVEPKNEIIADRHSIDVGGGFTIKVCLSLTPVKSAQKTAPYLSEMVMDDFERW